MFDLKSSFMKQEQLGQFDLKSSFMKQEQLGQFDLKSSFMKQEQLGQTAYKLLTELGHLRVYGDAANFSTIFWKGE